jgi:hypothetical protein
MSLLEDELKPELDVLSSLGKAMKGDRESLMMVKEENEKLKKIVEKLEKDLNGELEDQFSLIPTKLQLTPINSPDTVNLNNDLRTEMNLNAITNQPPPSNCTPGNVVSFKLFHSNSDSSTKNDSQTQQKMNEVEHQNACANIARILSDAVSNR